MFHKIEKIVPQNCFRNLKLNLKTLVLKEPKRVGEDLRKGNWHGDFKLPNHKYRYIIQANFVTNNNYNEAKFKLHEKSKYGY